MKKSRIVKKILAAVLSLAMIFGMTVFANAAEDAPFTTYAFAQTDAGWLMGYQEDTTYIFKGIQYGVADRFMPAQKAEAWEGVKGALTYGETCPNGSTSVSVSAFVDPLGQDMVQNENCLFLNVWTQSLDPEAKKPVIFFLHGGGLASGASNELASYDGKAISEYGDVVYVSVNHRLNVFGYMDLSAYGDEFKYSGNNGLADTVLALEWVHDNIANFGGDPENVTIMGQSGGCSKVAALMGTPAAKGLFSKAVQISGFGGSTGAPLEERQAAAAVIVDKCKEMYGLESDADAVEALRSMNVEALYEVVNAAGGFSANHTIDGDYYPEKTYDNEAGTWCELAKDIPLIVSSTFGEMAGKDGKLVLNMVINMSGAGFDPENPDAFLADVYKPNMTEEYMVSRVKDTYGDYADQILEMFAYGYPCRDALDVLSLYDRTNDVKECQAKAAQGGAPVYNCMVAYEFPLMGGNLMSHTTDLALWFHNLDTRLFEIKGDEETARKVENEMSSALVNFAYTGDPSSDLAAWAPFTVENGETMVFDDESQVINYPDLELQEVIKEATPPSSGSEAAESEEAEEAPSEGEEGASEEAASEGEAGESAEAASEGEAGESAEAPSEGEAGESPEAPAEGTAAPAGDEDLLAAYKQYMTDWLMAEFEVNGNMTEEQLPEFQACIDANDYSQFPGDMFFNGMLENGTAMTFEEFAASR